MIGCGAVTERKSAPAYSQVAGFDLVAVASRRASAARNYALQHGLPLAFDHGSELIHSPEVDAVYIATPPSSHFDLAIQTARAGKPCCVEKPLAMTHAEATQLVCAFKAARQPLFVSYYRRSLPRFKRVQQWLEQGAIGRVRHIHWSLARQPTGGDLAGDLGWRTDRKEAPGGYFEDLGCHGLNLFDFLLGPIVDASGVSQNQQGFYEVPDAVAASWRHAGGMIGSGFWNFASAKRADEVQIIGSEGMIRFSVFDEVPLVLETPSTNEVLNIENPDPIQLNHVKNMMLHLSGGECHPSLGESAARTDWVLDQVLGPVRTQRH
ncbi:Gfo/Idh/MocA family oxidoreductase [Sphingomonas sp.]|uniref:Gfo/Idh/MocA family protein n=1 Tax=Sphingomonas sp. TaxID=28214 RepID=UPI0017DE7E18|nr:Gfo/Idh/MocA family oxidoreductase [Sphingomonas sp.]MBA3511547.1 Gfo/Idh/MocA family oxidoreductase [Sphingomonas sp.]